MVNLAGEGLFGGRFLGRRVLVTGHTGFKGTWLAEWLLCMGADVIGFSAKEPVSEPALFDVQFPSSFPRLGVADVRGDICDREQIVQLLKKWQPDLVFHLAAQSLVRSSYRQPFETFATNVMGTASLLDALRNTGRSCAVVVVSSDKCYENHNTAHPCREGDPLGGHDPYSSSKACAELVVDAYRHSFFAERAGSASPREPRLLLASARSGNVIGGGDWALDRIIPDCVRSLAHGEPVTVRNPHATRPWQHVLEPLGGYLTLGARLLERLDARNIDACPPGHSRIPTASPLESGFNFGPDSASNHTVRELVEEFLKSWPEANATVEADNVGLWKEFSGNNEPLEATHLRLAIDKARHLLDWRPVWNFSTAVRHTGEWYHRYIAVMTATKGTAELDKFTRMQIRDYCKDAARQRLLWANPDGIR